MLRELLLIGVQNSEIRKIIFRSLENQCFSMIKMLLRLLEAAVDRYNIPLDQLPFTDINAGPITNFSTFQDWCTIFRGSGMCANRQPYRIPDFVLSSYKIISFWIYSLRSDLPDRISLRDLIFAKFERQDVDPIFRISKTGSVLPVKSWSKSCFRAGFCSV